MKKILTFSIVLFVLFVIAVYSILACSVNWESNITYDQFEITYEQALQYIDAMEKSHQQVVDHPERYDSIYGIKEQKLLGDIEFHKNAVTRYKQLRQFIVTNLGESSER